MTGYKILRLNDMVNALGLERAVQLLSSFSCPQNRDVEKFIRHKSYAIEFDKQAISRSYIVATSYKNEIVIVGYFTLTNKSFLISTKNLSKTLIRKVRKHGIAVPEVHGFRVSAPLIAQLGKNYTDGYNKLISGDELIKMALERIESIQMDIGGKIVYVECEDKPSLLEFYARHGFREFDRRQLDRDEREDLFGSHLVQLLRCT